MVPLLLLSAGISFVNLRLFGVFGIGEAPHRVVPYLIANLRGNQPVDLTPGKQIRDWLYIDDVVDALLAAAACAHLRDTDTFNICSGHGISVRELAEQVADAMKKPSDLLRFGARSYRTDEPMWIVGDNRRFVETTGWQPRISIAGRNSPHGGRGATRMTTDSQEFDHYAARLQVAARSLRQMSGDGAEYFCEYKARYIARIWAQISPERFWTSAAVSVCFPRG